MLWNVPGIGDVEARALLALLMHFACHHLHDWRPRDLPSDRWRRDSSSGGQPSSRFLWLSVARVELLFVQNALLELKVVRNRVVGSTDGPK